MGRKGVTDMVTAVGSLKHNLWDKIPKGLRVLLFLAVVGVAAIIAIKFVAANTEPTTIYDRTAKQTAAQQEQAAPNNMAETAASNRLSPAEVNALLQRAKRPNNLVVITTDPRFEAPNVKAANSAKLGQGFLARGGQYFGTLTKSISPEANAALQRFAQERDIKPYLVSGDKISATPIVSGTRLHKPGTVETIRYRMDWQWFPAVTSTKPPGPRQTALVEVDVRYDIVQYQSSAGTVPAAQLIVVGFRPQ